MRTKFDYFPIIWQNWFTFTTPETLSWEPKTPYLFSIIFPQQEFSAIAIEMFSRQSLLPWYSLQRQSSCLSLSPFTFSWSSEVFHMIKPACYQIWKQYIEDANTRWSIKGQNGYRNMSYVLEPLQRGKITAVQSAGEYRLVWKTWQIVQNLKSCQMNKKFKKNQVSICLFSFYGINWFPPVETEFTNGKLNLLIS